MQKPKMRQAQVSVSGVLEVNKISSSNHEREEEMRAYPHGSFKSQKALAPDATKEAIEAFLAKNARVNCKALNANISKAQCGQNHLRALEVDGLAEFDSKNVYRKPCLSCATGKANAADRVSTIKKCSVCNRPMNFKMMSSSQRKSGICSSCQGNLNKKEFYKSRDVLREMA